MVRHSPRLAPQVPRIPLPYGIPVVHLSRLFPLSKDASRADPASEDVAIAELMQELSLQFELEGDVAGFAEAEDISVIVGKVEMGKVVRFMAVVFEMVPAFQRHITGRNLLFLLFQQLWVINLREALPRRRC